MLDSPDDRPTRSRPRRRGRPAQHGEHAISEADLLAHAFKAFAERGYEGTRLRELSKQLGVSHNLINVRFGKKAELWKRAVDWRMQLASAHVNAAFDEAGDDETRLRHLIHRFCLWTTQNPDVIGLSDVEGRRNTWRMEYIAEQFVLPFKRRLDALVANVAKVRPVSPVSTSALMSMLVQGAGFFFGSPSLQQRLGVAEEVDSANAPRQAALIAEFLLAGLLPEHDAS